MADKNVTSVVFMGSRLTEIPLEVFKTFKFLGKLNVNSSNLAALNQLENCINLERFIGSHNRIEILLEDIFGSCKYLLDIDLRSNLIRTIFGSPFKLLKKLKRIDLGMNQIKRIEWSTFTFCRKLVYLNLTYNKIENIDYDAFVDLTGVRELDLSTNQYLTHLNPQLFKECKNLELLHLNYIKKMDIWDNRTFHYLKNLKMINLSENNFTVLHPEIFRENLKLEKILMASSDISKIHPSFFDELRNLKHLDLSGNSCVNQSFVIFDGNLEGVKIGLTDCFDNYYPNDPCHFKITPNYYMCFYENVTILENQEFSVCGDHLPGRSNYDVNRVEFRSSKLAAIPDDIFIVFQSLKHLNVESTGLEMIKPLKNCRELREFKGSHNKIEILSQDSFAGCSNLQIIELNSNRVKRIESSSLIDLHGLRELYLDDNLLTELDQQSFALFGSNLEKLHLSRNQINLENRIFENLHMLKEIDLSENHLTVLQEDAFRKTWGPSEFACVFY
jgi:Leucine-rich repeat (LRR) protein